MRLGIAILPEHPWEEGQRIWRDAEALGFHHAWTYDHLAWRDLRDEPWWGCMPLLAAAAAVTRSIRLGPLVASPNFRHPVAFARELITVDDISGGRLMLGLGSGSTGWDATLLGQPSLTPLERAERFHEFTGLLDSLLTSATTSHEGRYFVADDAPMAPGCVQRPRIPFVVAATGPRTLRTAARWGDVWLTNGPQDHRGPPLDPLAGVEVVHDQLKRLHDACEAVGRDPDELDKMVLTGTRLDPGLQSRDALEATVGRYEEIGITDLVVHRPRPRDPYAGDLARFERLVGGLLAKRAI